MYTIFYLLKGDYILISQVGPALAEHLEFLLEFHGPAVAEMHRAVVRNRFFGDGE